MNTGNRIEGAVNCPSWCRPLRLYSISCVQSSLSTGYSFLLLIKRGIGKLLQEACHSQQRKAYISVQNLDQCATVSPFRLKLVASTISTYLLNVKYMREMHVFVTSTDHVSKSTLHEDMKMRQVYNLLRDLVSCPKL